MNDSHPDPKAWWLHRRIGNYVGIAGLVSLPFVPGADAVKEYIAIGCIVLIAAYGPSSTIVDAIKAWRS